MHLTLPKYQCTILLYLFVLPVNIVIHVCVGINDAVVVVSLSLVGKFAVRASCSKDRPHYFLCQRKRSAVGKYF